MVTTIQRFQVLDTVDYSLDVRRKMSELLDSSSETEEIQYKIIFVSTSSFDQGKVRRMLKPTLDAIDLDVEIEFVGEEDLANKIYMLHNRLDRVEVGQVNIEASKKYVEYSSDEMRGAFTNVWASSIYKLYEKFSENGLFNLNVRKYIARKSIDEGIVNTIRNESNDFWFFNNGLTIGAKDYYFDGDNLKLYDFSIVNGAQTTSLIGKHLNTNKDFLVPVKIIAPREELHPSAEKLENFFTEIAESTNSQKPISPRDLKANAREMRSLRKWLNEEFNVEFRVKQGVKPSNKAKYIIKNDDFAKLIQSFIYQRPGSARSNAKALFENKDIYHNIFIATNFDQTADKKQFVYDLITLNDMYDSIVSSGKYSKQETSFLKQSKMTMFAIFGLIYRFQHGLISASNVQEHEQYNDVSNFEMKGFISTYKMDDLEVNFQDIVYDYLLELQDAYQEAYDAELVGSVSNFFKLDKTYKTTVMGLVRKILKKMETRDGFHEDYDIFKTTDLNE